MKDKFFSNKISVKRKRKSDSKGREFEQEPEKNDDFEQETELYDDSMDLERDSTQEDSNSDSETAQEKRIRLAKLYLSKIGTNRDEESIQKKLTQDALRVKGILFKKVDTINPKIAFSFTGNKKSVIACIFNNSESTVYSAGKDGLVVRWGVESGKRLGNLKFKKQVNCLAISSSGQYLAIGLQKKILIFQKNSTKIPSKFDEYSKSGDFPFEIVQVFSQHRDSITSLVFQKTTPEQDSSSNTDTCNLYSASADRSIKVFNMENMVYVETLFGHQDHISDIDTIGFENQRCVSTGSRDRTARLWKIVEESQLVFRGGQARSRFIKSDSEWAPVGDIENTVKLVEEMKRALFMDETGSLDVIGMLTEQKWVTGSDGGTISIWSIHKKKPLANIVNAHGRSFSDLENPNVRWSYNHDFISLTASFIKTSMENDSMSNEIDTCLESDDDNSVIQKADLELTSNINYNATFQQLKNRAASEESRRDFITVPNWISSIACLPFSNIFASGSSDGFVRIWKVKDDSNSTHAEESDNSDSETENRNQKKSKGLKKQGGEITEIAKIPIQGHINSLSFSNDANYLAVGVGQEPKLGRWNPLPGAKNGTKLISLNPTFSK